MTPVPGDPARILDQCWAWDCAVITSVVSWPASLRSTLITGHSSQWWPTEKHQSDEKYLWLIYLRKWIETSSVKQECPELIGYIRKRQKKKSHYEGKSCITMELWQMSWNMCCHEKQDSLQWACSRHLLQTLQSVAFKIFHPAIIYSLLHLWDNCNTLVLAALLLSSFSVDAMRALKPSLYTVSVSQQMSCLVT